MSNLAQQVHAHAASMPEGARLSAKTLLHLGGRAAVDQALSRLARSVELPRAGRGVYVLQVKSNCRTRAPKVAKVVQEWASQRGETVVGNSATAVNALGLPTQVRAQSFRLLRLSFVSFTVSAHPHGSTGA